LNDFTADRPEAHFTLEVREGSGYLADYFSLNGIPTDDSSSCEKNVTLSMPQRKFKP
jgi:hypothetical protein